MRCAASACPKVRCIISLSARPIPGSRPTTKCVSRSTAAWKSSLSEWLLTLLAMRATVLEIALFATFVIGWPLAHLLPIDRFAAALENFVRAMDRKLNRAKRDVATRAWRGVIATFVIIIPAAALGAWLDT